MDSIASPFPMIRIASPDARERGRMMGEAAKDRIAETVAAYEETFHHYTGLGWDRITDLALEFGPPIEEYDSSIFEEIGGIAEGAGLTLGDLLAINVRSEIMFGLDVVPPPECTAFFVAPTETADGHVLMGQNWDWRPRAIDSTTFFEIDQGPDLPAIAMLPEAGLIGKAGFNQHGIGVTLNALVSDRDVGERLVPIHVILRAILNSATIEEAVMAIVRARRASSGNYTLGASSGVGLVAEVGPGGVDYVNLMHPADGFLARSSHFCSEVPFEDIGIGKWPDSTRRLDTMCEFLFANRGKLTPEVLKVVLRNSDGHPDAICRFPNPDHHPIEQSATVASVIMDLTDLTLDIAAGAPSENDYVRFTPEFATAAAATH